MADINFKYIYSEDELPKNYRGKALVSLREKFWKFKKDEAWAYVQRLKLEPGTINDVNPVLRSPGYSVLSQTCNPLLMDKFVLWGANFQAINNRPLWDLAMAENITSFGYYSALIHKLQIPLNSVDRTGKSFAYRLLSVLGKESYELVVKELKMNLNTVQLTPADLLDLKARKDYSLLFFLTKEKQIESPEFQIFNEFPKNFKLQDKHHFLPQVMGNAQLRDYLKAKYQWCSKQFVRLVYEKVYDTKAQIVNLDILNYVDYGYKLFIKDKVKPNHGLLFNLLNSNDALQNFNQMQEATRGRNINLAGMFGFFNDEQVYRLASGGGHDRYLMQDLVLMVSDCQKREFFEFIQETPFNQINDFKKFHDELNRFKNKYRHPNFKLKQDVTFPGLKEIDGKMILEKFQVKVAEDQHQLLDWGNQLSHCIGTASYGRDAKAGRCILLGFFDGNEIVYTAEISTKGEIRQFRGKCNKEGPANLKKQVVELLKNLYNIKK